MDELINYLMDNPNNTNPNVVRDMLGNISGSISGEPNIEIFEGRKYEGEGRLPAIISLQQGDNIEFLSIYLIENIEKGTINNLSEKTTYVKELSFGGVGFDSTLNSNQTLYPATLETMYPLTTEQIDTLNTSGQSGYFYTFNKQVSVLFDEREGRVYLTQDQIDNDLTFIKKTGGIS